MSSLSNLEKRHFEKLLGMSSGYVLDFTNRTFAEFVVDSVGLNIFDSRFDFGSGSKANRLRKLWQTEDDAVVAKLMTDVLNYGFPVGHRSGPSDAKLESLCRQTVTRLLGARAQGRTAASSFDTKAGGSEHSSRAIDLSHRLEKLEQLFYQLAADKDRNNAGLALEQLLNQLFEAFGLEPRQPFRIVGEQIDGSFVLDGHVYLMESKWEKDPLPEADLLVFRGKIEGKSTFTRGVLIALNDVSSQARHAITQGKAPSFFVMNGHDLLMILHSAVDLPGFLRKRVRLLAEEGRMFVPFSEVGESS
jgi:hypothetical protein